MNRRNKIARESGEGGIFIDPERRPWPHELRTARTLALAGYRVDFLPESSLLSADILLDGVEFEMKAPKTDKTESLEQLIRKALKQSPNIIIDSFRMKMNDDVAKRFLIRKCQEQKQIKRMLFITKKREIMSTTHQNVTLFIPLKCHPHPCFFKYRNSISAKDC